MLERTEERFGLKPQRLAADSAYGSAPMLNWLVEDKQITPHIPSLTDRTERTAPSRAAISGTTPRGDAYDCPTGKELRTSGTVHEGTTLLYRASKLDCDRCSLGVKGAGEAGVAPATSAVINAIVDALKEFGVTRIEMPATASQIWRAIRTARSSK